MVETIELPFYRVLMDGIQDMVFIIKVGEDTDFYIDFLNRSAMEGTGFTQNVVGKTLGELYPKEKASFLYGQYHKVVTSNESVTYEDSFTSPLGDRFYSEISLTPILDGEKGCTHIVAHVHDITEKFTKIRHSENKFRFIAEHIHDLITVLDDQGKITYASPSYQAILGFDPKEYEGQLFLHHVHPDDIHGLRDALSMAEKNKQPFKLQLKQKKGKKDWIWSELHGTPIFSGRGRLVHIVIVTRDITLQKEYESKLEHFAFHDSLTELPNRRLLNKYLTQTLSNHQEKGNGFAIIMMDIDNFKTVNDQMGHDIGDAVILEFGKRVQNQIREIDIVARLGGDEFVLLLPRIESVDHARIIAERIQKAVREPWRINDEMIEVTASMGIVAAINPVQNLTGSSILKLADEALYEAKDAGKSTYKIRVV